MTSDTPAAAPRGWIRAPQNLAAGLALLALAAFALWATSDLDQGTLRSMGPAMMPRWTATLIALLGAALVLGAFLSAGAALERFAFRGPFFVTVAVLAFAVTIREVGLAVSGPLVVIVSGAATPEVRFKELVVVAVLLTAFSLALFRYALRLPIPVLVLPGVVTL